MPIPTQENAHIPTYHWFGDERTRANSLKSGENYMCSGKMIRVAMCIPLHGKRYIHDDLPEGFSTAQDVMGVPCTSHSATPPVPPPQASCFASDCR